MAGYKKMHFHVTITDEELKSLEYEELKARVEFHARRAFAEMYLDVIMDEMQDVLEKGTEDE
jgi:hypothetical protein